EDLVRERDRHLATLLGQLPVNEVGHDRGDALLEGLLVVWPAAPLAETEVALVVLQLVHDFGHDGVCSSTAGAAPGIELCVAFRGLVLGLWSFGNERLVH